MKSASGGQGFIGVRRFFCEDRGDKRQLANCEMSGCGGFFTRIGVKSGSWRGVGCPRQGNSPSKERSKLVARKSLLVADGEWDARRKLTPRLVW